MDFKLKWRCITKKRVGDSHLSEGVTPSYAYLTIAKCTQRVTSTGLGNSATWCLTCRNSVKGNHYMDNNIFRQQFIFTKASGFSLNWDSVKIADFILYYHPDLQFTSILSNKICLYMLGSLYDWINPEQSNQMILDKLASQVNFNDFINSLSSYMGEYIIIYKDQNNFLLLNDATGQQEIYYDDAFTTFGSTPKLISKLINLQPHTDENMKILYSSKTFLKQKIFLSDTTHAKNIFYLLPNHLINLNDNTVKRFFPFEKLLPKPFNHVTEKATVMIKGYIKAIALRQKLAIPFTGGIDSRVIFFASLNLDAIYYVYKFNYMDDKHHDIAIPLAITTACKREFHVIQMSDQFENLSNSFDFPNEVLKPEKYFFDRIYLNGNISEIGRAEFGTLKKVSASDLALIKGYKSFKPAIIIFERWLKGTEVCTKNDYNILDMLSWEQSKTVAKVMAEDNAIGLNTISPFNSRELINLMLSVDRKFRDYYNNKLHKSILLTLDPSAMDYPVNDYFKFKVKKMLSKLKIFNFLRYSYKKSFLY